MFNIFWKEKEGVEKKGILSFKCHNNLIIIEDRDTDPHYPFQQTEESLISN